MTTLPIILGCWGEEPVDNGTANVPSGYLSPSLRDTINYLQPMGFRTQAAKPLAKHGDDAT